MKALKTQSKTMKPIINFYIKIISNTFIVLFGLFAILIISHECYHYFSIDGDLIGVCFGNCAVSEEGAIAAGLIVFNFTEDQLNNLNRDREEIWAWRFSICITLLLITVLVCSNIIIPYYTNSGRGDAQ